MSEPGSLSVASRGECEIVMSRAFDAPRPLVFEACARPVLLRRWLGVYGGRSLAVCENHLEEGGALRFVWHGRGGGVVGMRGTYREVVVPERLVFTRIADAPAPPGSERVTVSFGELGPTRTSILVTVLFDSKGARDGLLASPTLLGLAASFENLADLLAPAAELGVAEEDA